MKLTALKISIQIKQTSEKVVKMNLFHLLAVKKSLNMTLGKPEKPVRKNLSLLRKKSKPRVAKKTGQKKKTGKLISISILPQTPLQSTTQNKHEQHLMKTPKSDSKLILKTPKSKNQKSFLKRKLSMSVPTSKSRKE